MNTKQQTIAILVLVMSLVLSACGPGQVFGPTITPTPTLTSTPTITPTLAPSATPTVTFTPTSTLTPTPSCTVQNGDWSGDFSDFKVDNCTITSASFTIQANGGGTDTITLIKQSIPIANNEFQYSFTTQNTGAFANSQTNMVFSGTFSSPTEFKGILQLPEGPVTIKASLFVPTETPTWGPPDAKYNNEIPIMPGAITGQKVDSTGNPWQEWEVGTPYAYGGYFSTGNAYYDFTIKASPADIIAYYEQQMPTLGWKESSKNGSTEVDFTRGSMELIITIHSSENDTNMVQIDEHSQ